LLKWKRYSKYICFKWKIYSTSFSSSFRIVLQPGPTSWISDSFAQVVSDLTAESHQLS